MDATPKLMRLPRFPLVAFFLITLLGPAGAQAAILLTDSFDYTAGQTPGTSLLNGGEGSTGGAGHRWIEPWRRMAGAGFVVGSGGLSYPDGAAGSGNHVEMASGDRARRSFSGVYGGDLYISLLYNAGSDVSGTGGVYFQNIGQDFIGHSNGFFVAGNPNGTTGQAIVADQTYHLLLHADLDTQQYNFYIDPLEGDFGTAVATFTGQSIVANLFTYVSGGTGSVLMDEVVITDTLDNVQFAEGGAGASVSAPGSLPMLVPGVLLLGALARRHRGRIDGAN